MDKVSFSIASFCANNLRDCSRRSSNSHWFRVTLKVPESWSKAERVQLEFDPSCEGCVFDTEGCPLQGLTGGYDNLRRVEFILPKAKRASTYKYYIEVSSSICTLALISPCISTDERSIV